MSEELSTVTITVCTPKKENARGEYHYEMEKWTTTIKGGKCSVNKLNNLLNNVVVSKTIDADPDSIYVVLTDMSFYEGEHKIIKLNNDNPIELINLMLFIFEDILKNDDSDTKETSIIVYDVHRFFIRYTLVVDYNYVLDWEQEEKQFIECFTKAKPHEIESSSYPSYYTSYYIQPQILS